MVRRIAWLFCLFALSASRASGNAEVLAQKLETSVVIVASGNQAGTGVVINTRGDILAPLSLSQSNGVTVYYKGKNGAFIGSRDVKLEKIHPATDMAILRLSGETSLKPIAKTNVATVGESVYLFGMHALGNSPGFSITNGIISGIDRPLGGCPRMQVTTPIHYGHAGAPIVNTRGQMVAIVSQPPIQFGIGLVIPISDIPLDKFETPRSWIMPPPGKTCEWKDLSASPLAAVSESTSEDAVEVPSMMPPKRLFEVRCGCRISQVFVDSRNHAIYALDETNWRILCIDSLTCMQTRVILLPFALGHFAEWNEREEMLLLFGFDSSRTSWPLSVAVVDMKSGEVFVFPALSSDGWAALFDRNRAWVHLGGTDAVTCLIDFRKRKLEKLTVAAAWSRHRGTSPDGRFTAAEMENRLCMLDAGEKKCLRITRQEQEIRNADKRLPVLFYRNGEYCIAGSHRYRTRNLAEDLGAVDGIPMLVSEDGSWGIGEEGILDITEGRILHRMHFHIPEIFPVMQQGYRLPIALENGKLGYWKALPEEGGFAYFSMEPTQAELKPKTFRLDESSHPPFSQTLMDGGQICTLGAFRRFETEQAIGEALVDAAGRRMLNVAPGSNIVEVVDLDTGLKLHDLHLSGAPSAHSLDPDRRQLYYTISSEPGIHAIHYEENASEPPLLGGDVWLRIHYENDALYAVGEDPSRCCRLNLRNQEKILVALPVGLVPGQIYPVPGNESVLYAADATRLQQLAIADGAMITGETERSKLTRFFPQRPFFFPSQNVVLFNDAILNTRFLSEARDFFFDPNMPPDREGNRRPLRILDCRDSLVLLKDAIGRQTLYLSSMSHPESLIALPLELDRKCGMKSGKFDANFGRDTREVLVTFPEYKAVFIYPLEWK